MKLFEKYKTKINNITKKYNSILFEQSNKTIEMTFPAFTKESITVPLDNVGTDGGYKISGGKDSRLFQINYYGKLKFRTMTPSGPLEKNKHFKFEVQITDPTGTKHDIIVKVPNEKTPISNQPDASNKLTIAYLQAKEGLATAGAQRHSIYFRLQDLIDIFKALKVDNRVSNARIDTKWFDNVRGEYVPAGYDTNVGWNDSNRQTITVEQLKTITDWMTVSWDEHVNPSIVNNRYPANDVNNIGYSKGQLFNLGNRIQKLSSEKITQTAKPVPAANPSFRGVTLDELEQALALIDEKSYAKNVDIKNASNTAGTADINYIDWYDVPLPGEALTKILAKRDSSSARTVSEIQAVQIIEDFFKYALSVQDRYEQLENGLQKTVNDLKKKYKLVEEYHSIRPDVSSKEAIDRKNQIGIQIKKVFGTDADYLMSQDVFMNLRTYQIQDMMWISGFDDNLKSPPYKELETYIKKVYIPNVQKLQPTYRKIWFIYPQLRDIYNQILPNRANQDEVLAELERRRKLLDTQARQNIFNLQNKEISRQVAKKVANRIAAEQETAIRNEIRLAAKEAVARQKAGEEELANRNFIRSEAARIVREKRLAAEQEAAIRNKIRQAAANAGAAAKGARDQDLYGPDDDAPLSQSELGARDQDLYGSDDDKPLSQAERGAREQDLYGPADDLDLSKAELSAREELDVRNAIRDAADAAAERSAAGEEELANRNFIRSEAARIVREKRLAAEQEAAIRNAIRDIAAATAASKKAERDQDFFGPDDDAPLSPEDEAEREELANRQEIRQKAQNKAEARQKELASTSELANRNYIRQKARDAAAEKLRKQNQLTAAIQDQLMFNMRDEDIKWDQIRKKSKAITKTLINRINNAINRVDEISIAEISYIRQNLDIMFMGKNFKGKKHIDTILDDPEAINEIDKMADGFQTLLTSRLDVLNKDVDEAVELYNQQLEKARENTRTVDTAIVTTLLSQSFRFDLLALKDMYPYVFTKIGKTFSLDIIDVQDKIDKFEQSLPILKAALGNKLNDPFYKLNEKVEMSIIQLQAKSTDADIDEYVDVLEELDRLDELVIDSDMQIIYDTRLNEFELTVDTRVIFEIRKNQSVIRDMMVDVNNAVLYNKPYTMELFKPWQGIFDKWKAIGEIYDTLGLEPSDEYKEHSTRISDLISYMPLDTLPFPGRSKLDKIQRDYYELVWNWKQGQRLGDGPNRGSAASAQDEIEKRKQFELTRKDSNGFPVYDSEGNFLEFEKGYYDFDGSFITDPNSTGPSPREDYIRLLARSSPAEKIRDLLVQRRQYHMDKAKQYLSNPKADPYIARILEGMQEGSRQSRGWNDNEIEQASRYTERYLKSLYQKYVTDKDYKEKIKQARRQGIRQNWAEYKPNYGFGEN